MKTLILGMGNPLRSDDGVGIHVVDALRNEGLSPNVDLREGLTGLDITGEIAGYNRVIIVDAIKSGGQPGTIYELTLDSLTRRQPLHAFTTHDVDIAAIIEFGKKLFPGKMPEDIRIIAIEADDITTISDKCTPKVERAIKEAVGLIKDLL